MTRTITITGASSGIGYQALIRMIKKGYKVIAPCRNNDRSEFLLKNIRTLSFWSDYLEKNLYLPIVDLSRLEDINKFSEVMISNKTIIDCLVLNAGIQYTGSKEPRWSNNGFELTFATNHLSHLYLTYKLLPLIFKSNRPRIVITSSEVHNPNSPGGKVGELANLGELNGLRNGKGFKMIDGNSIFNADKAYKDSKLCNILFGRELFRRLTIYDKKMPVITWAPGLIIPKSNDGFFRYSRKYNELGQRLFAFLARDILNITETPEKAGQILFSLATDSVYNEKNFLYKCNKIVRPGKKVLTNGEISEEGLNDNKANILWDLSCKLLNIESFLK